MADLADKSGSVYSNIVNNNDDSVTFTVPNTPTLSVESVVATVDNSAAGSAATLTITIQDQDGQVIAKKAMPSTIPAGDTGVGTFALGLDDAAASAVTASTPTAIYGNFAAAVPAGGGWPAGRISFAFSSGTDFLDLVTNGADFPTFVDAGVYSISVVASSSIAAEPAGTYVSQVNLDVNATTASTTTNQGLVLNTPGFSDSVGVANTQAVAAGDTLDVFVANNFTAAHNYGVYFVIQRLS